MIECASYRCLVCKLVLPMRAKIGAHIKEAHKYAWTGTNHFDGDRGRYVHDPLSDFYEAIP